MSDREKTTILARLERAHHMARSIRARSGVGDWTSDRASECEDELLYAINTLRAPDSAPDGVEGREAVHPMEVNEIRDLVGRCFDEIDKELYDVETRLEARRPTEMEERDGAALIAQERRRQVSVEGWDSDHDHGHQDAELAVAAFCYLGGYIERHHAAHEPDVPEEWPWDRRWWKPKDPVRDLVRAGALIAAELDRLLGASPPDSEEPTMEREELDGLVKKLCLEAEEHQRAGNGEAAEQAWAYADALEEVLVDLRSSDSEEYCSKCGGPPSERVEFCAEINCPHAFYSEGEESFAGTLTVTGATTFDTGPHPEFSARGDDRRAPTTGGGEREALERCGKPTAGDFTCWLPDGHEGTCSSRPSYHALYREIRAALASEPATRRATEDAERWLLMRLLDYDVGEEEHGGGMSTQDLEALAAEWVSGIAKILAEPATFRETEPDCICPHTRGRRLTNTTCSVHGIVRPVQPPTEGENDG